jgi:threonine dehydrogenase-like Zn-dependent dehydrogenase
MEVQDKEYPKLEDPQGRKVEHAAILKLVTTNICGSDLHIYNGRFAAPPGMQWATRIPVKSLRWIRMCNTSGMEISAQFPST